MSRLLLRSLCVAACLSSAFGQRVADFTAALEKAKSSKADIMVFVHGSDWNRPGEAAAKIWNDPRFLSNMGAGVLLVDIDRKENPTESEKTAAKRNEAGDPKVRSVPAVALYDDEGRLVGSFSGTSEIEAAGGLLNATKKLLAVRRGRDEFWKSANGSSGVMKAGRLGQGLDCMNLGLGPKDAYKPVLEEMKKADPDDKSGYIGKYTFSSEKLVDLAIDKAEKKDFTAADQELTRWDANPRLSPRQKQELQAARFALYQRWPEKKSALKPLLEKMRDIDPKSELGQAAVNYLEMLKSRKT
ncbi:hypothetical protein JIN84_14045 [Luteolibacter yonseiensis]|uniref:Uncharacterized protein n=1 Tax=Luteolibacter yonseiensis TaxID=1144680 RepID=A0A934VB02_9BACT|nr:hypothetical protein [Luteolibacter yonseiensis]MBK1816743.1 hypothetical protein [Luteolibacter yonseiensis]